MTTLTMPTNPADLVFSAGKQAKTTSLIVAEKFQKRHDNIIRSIENLECSEEFIHLNFEVSEYLDSTGKSNKFYQITKDGFMLLCMGFTGKEAMQFKLAFIAAFNKMEEQLKKAVPNLDALQDRFMKNCKFFAYMDSQKPQHLKKANELSINDTGVDILAMYGYEAKEDKLLSKIWQAFNDMNAGGQYNHHRNSKYLLAINIKEFHQKCPCPDVYELDTTTLRKVMKASKSPQFIEFKPMRSVINGSNRNCMIFKL